ncbi:MAG: hypothetical protein HXS44_16995 [Theionarchaea archaeon]|nr:hypothetical protein [Theionarchaea archaeon]
MENVEIIAELVQAEARDAFSKRANKKFCDLLEYAYEFRKEFMEKRL